MSGRIQLGGTALKVLAMIDKEGAVPLSHGARYAEINPYQIRVMASTNYLLRQNGMVEWAGGNYGRWHVKLTDYGRECLRRRAHSPGKRPFSFADSYGPRQETP